MDNSRAGLVFLSGAQGANASKVNGFWRATAERRQGRVVYVKVGDDSLCIEHFGGKWQVKSVSNKGNNISAASVTGGCALEACTSRVWDVGTGGSGLVPQPSVKMLFGADAEREVSCRCRLCARCNAPSITARARLRCRCHNFALIPTLHLAKSPEGKAAAKAKAEADAKAAAEAQAKAAAAAAAKAKAEADAKAAAEAQAHAAKFTRTVQLLQRLDLQEHIPKFM